MLDRMILNDIKTSKGVSAAITGIFRICRCCFHYSYACNLVKLKTAGWKRISFACNNESNRIYCR